MRRVYDVERDPAPRRPLDPTGRPDEVLEGTIERDLWGSMADWPEFSMRSDGGEQHRLARWGDVRRYVPGLRVRIRTREHRRPSEWGEGWRGAARILGDGPITSIVAVDIEESPARVSGVEPGPGGAGYRHRGVGATVLYYWLPERADADRLASLGAGRSHPEVMGGAWVVIVTTQPDAVRSRLDADVVRCGGHLDGYEVIMADTAPLVFGRDAS